MEKYGPVRIPRDLGMIFYSADQKADAPQSGLGYEMLLYNEFFASKSSSNHYWLKTHNLLKINKK
jgi:hypothetical protein